LTGYIQFVTLTLMEPPEEPRAPEPKQDKKGGIFSGFFGRKPIQPQSPILPTEPITANQDTSTLATEPETINSTTPRLDVSGGIPTRDVLDTLIEKKSKYDPEKYALIKTRADILFPLVSSPDKMGLTKEEEVAVRKYATTASERAAKETREKLSQSTAERIDTILLETAKKMGIPTDHPTNTYNHDTRRYPFTFTSYSLRDAIRVLRDEVITRQQELMATKEGVTLDEAADSIDQDNTSTRQHRVDTGEHWVTSNPFPEKAADVLFHELGIIPEGVTLKNFISGLQREGKWTDSAVTYGTTGSSYEISENILSPVKLATKIDGLKAVLQKTKGEYPLDNYSIRMIFDHQTFREMIKEPPQLSIFQRDLPSSTTP
jgi:hypothetical protein